MPTLASKKDLKTAQTTPKTAPEEEEAADAVSSSEPLFEMVHSTPDATHTVNPTAAKVGQSPALEITNLSSPYSTKSAQSPRAPLHVDKVFRITSLPDVNGISGFHNVTELILCDCNLTSLKGLELDRFPNLQLANFSFNQLKTIDEIGLLRNLEILNVAHNKLTNIEGVEELEGLEVLRLHNNNIESIQSISAMKGCNVLKELWVSRNAIDLPELLFLSNLGGLEHLVLSPNICSNSKNFEKIVVSFCNKLQTLDGKKIGPDDVNAANAYTNSTDGHGQLVKMKFDLLQNTKKKLAIENVNASNKSIKTSNEKKQRGDISPVRIKKVKKLRESVEVTRNRPPSPARLVAKEITEGETVGKSIADCLNLLPDLSEQTEKQKASRRIPKAKGSLKPKKKAEKYDYAGFSPVEGVVKFQPVTWAASGGGGGSGSGSGGVRSDGGGDHADNQPVATSPQLSSGKKQTLSQYRSGVDAVVLNSDGTAYAKWPNGAYSVNREEDRVTAQYDNGKIAVMFDQSGNGSVNYPTGKTAISMSTKQCLQFAKDGTISDASKKPVTIKLSDSLGVQFQASPFLVRIFFKCKNVHARFAAPYPIDGKTVTVIQGKGDVFGKTNAPKKEKKIDPYENESHETFLSAIANAVAGL